MVPTDFASGIALIARIERIGSGPFGGFGGEVAAIQDSVDSPRDSKCHAVANILDPVFPWPANTHVFSFAQRANLGLL
jgi:hypothetical protein